MVCAPPNPTICPPRTSSFAPSKRSALFDVETGVAVGVLVGGAGEAVGVLVDGSGVAVGPAVADGETGVLVGGTGVAVGVLVGGSGVAVGVAGGGVPFIITSPYSSTSRRSNVCTSSGAVEGGGVVRLNCTVFGPTGAPLGRRTRSAPRAAPPVPHR